MPPISTVKMNGFNHISELCTAKTVGYILVIISQVYNITESSVELELEITFMSNDLQYSNVCR